MSVGLGALQGLQISVRLWVLAQACAGAAIGGALALLDLPLLRALKHTQQAVF
jgi:hypothetical protein